MSSSKKRKSYDASYKLKAVERVENSSKEAAAREFGVDAKRIRVWCSQKEKLKATKDKKATRKRLDGAGRKPNDVEMEEELFEWIVDLRSRHLRVSRRMIQMQAKTLSTDDSFKASRGWLLASNNTLFLVNTTRHYLASCHDVSTVKGRVN